MDNTIWIYYKDNTDGITLVRLYGNYPEVCVPAEIDDRPVTKLGAYSFSEKTVATDGCSLCFVRTGDNVGRDAGTSADRKEVSRPADEETLRSDFEREFESGLICELAGDFIETVVLPDTLKSIGELSFYQCRNLQEISFGGGNIEIGSDAFMNCRSLSTIRIRAGSEEPTALRSILNQRTQKTDVYFDDAAVHFPEYQEKYDLIGPAHIFELNIEGEGFRARKCFEGDRFSLTMYDEVFQHAVEKEDERTLCRMAALRLGSQSSDSESAGAQGYKKAYQDYLLSHMDAFCDDLIRRRDLSVWRELFRLGVVGKEHKMLLLKKLTESGWVEGTREMLGA